MNPSLFFLIKNLEAWEPNWLEKIWVGEVSPTYWWSGFIVDKVCGFNITFVLSMWV